MYPVTGAGDAWRMVPITMLTPRRSLSGGVVILLAEFFISSRRQIGIVLAILFFVWPTVAQTATKNNAYLDRALPLAQRVDDLVSRMTLVEKVSQMQNNAP